METRTAWLAAAGVLLVAIIAVGAFALGGNNDDDEVDDPPAEDVEPGDDEDDDEVDEDEPDAAIQQLQRDLAELGYYSGLINGDFDGATETALREFQQFSELSIDGVYGPSTANALSVALGRSAPTTNLQGALARLCLYSGAIDGHFGPGTAVAIRQLQRNAGITDDANYGPQTADALVAAWSSRPEQCPEPAPATAIAALIDGTLVTFGADVSCVQTAEDGVEAAGTADDGTTISLVLDGTASVITAAGPSGDFSVEPSSVSTSEDAYVFEATSPTFEADVPFSLCESAES